MSQFDHEYFFVERPNNECLPILSPDKDTVAKPFRYEKLPLGQKPLIFYNGLLEDCLKNGLMPIDPPPDVLFSVGDLVVREHIAKKLDDLEIPNLAIQPAIYIDHKKKWHEDYWFLTFTKKFDCWDRKHSKYDPEPAYGDPTTFDVYVYSLNAELLQKTPLQERLLFKMGGSMIAPIVVHESIAGLFRMEGVDIVSVADFGVNYP